MSVWITDSAMDSARCVLKWLTGWQMGWSDVLCERFWVSIIPEPVQQELRKAHQEWKSGV